MTPPLASAAPSLKPVGPGFIALYMGAQVGAYIAFIPLLTILLSLKAGAIDPVHRAQLLSQVALWGALTAGLANVVAGMIGDRTRHWTGGRSLWMALGLAGTIASYGLIHRASTPGDLMMAIIALQIALNFMLNPLAATLPDRVPPSQRGTVAGFTGLAFPLSSLFGAVVIGVWLTSEPERLTAIVVVTTIMVVPFILNGLNRVGRADGIRRPPLDLVVLRDRDFMIALVSRLLVQTAVALNVLYLLLFLERVERFGPYAGMRPEVVLGGLLALSTVLSVVAGLVSGVLSDGIGRRRLWVCIGGLLIATGALVMAGTTTWPGPIVGQSLMGIGVGIYGITEAALAADVLPDAGQTGRDMGLMNVAVTAAQVLGPVIGLALLHLAGDGLRLVYAAGALLAVAGAVSVLGIKRVS